MCPFKAEGGTSNYIQTTNPFETKPVTCKLHVFLYMSSYTFLHPGPVLPVVSEEHEVPLVVEGDRPEAFDVHVATWSPRTGVFDDGLLHGLLQVTSKE